MPKFPKCLFLPKRPLSPAAACLILVLLSVLPNLCYPQATPEPTTLAIDKTLEGELSGTQEQAYQISLLEGQYARVALKQKGIDVYAQRLGVDGKSVVVYNAELRTYGEEVIEMVAAAAGRYRLVVKAVYPKLPGGRYEITLTEARAASENDRLLDEARKLHATAYQLHQPSRFAEAFPLAEKALELREQVLGHEHPHLTYTLFLLGRISQLKYDHQRAEAFYMRALANAEKTLGPDDPWVARILANFAYYYFYQRSDYDRSEALYQRSLMIWEKSLGPDHPEVAATLSGQGYMYLTIGDNLRAETALVRAIAIGEKVYGEGNGQVANTLSWLGSLYNQMGDYAKAEPLLVRSLNYWEKIYGPDRGWVAIGLDNLALLYLNKGDYDAAERLFQRAISINEKNNSPDHPAVLRGRFYLADVYYRRGDYVKAMEVCDLRTLEKVFGRDDLMVGKHSHLLAKIYIAQNDHTKAEPLARRALTILQTKGGENYPVLADILLDLARISAAKQKYSEATTFQIRANGIIEYNLKLNLSRGSERQKLAYLSTLPEYLDQAVSLHTSAPADNVTAGELAAATVLQRKGRVQDAVSNSLISLRNSFGEEDRELLDRLNTVTSRLAGLVLSDPKDRQLAEHQKRIKDLEDQREKLEIEISRRSSGFYQMSGTTSLASVRAAIPSDAALVEFAIYRPFDPKASNAKAYGSPRYVVYILKRDGDVQWKDLGLAKDIDNDIDRLRRALRDPGRRDTQTLARSVDEKVMQSVRVLAGNVNHLFISPEGELNLIPFETFVDENGRYLIENFSITYLTTGRDLVRLQTERRSRSLPAVVADPVFGEQRADQLLASTSPGKARWVTKRRSVTNTRNLSDTYFAALSGTAREAASIKSVFPDASLFTGSAATETMVKDLVAPKMLHIATHGYFLDDARTDSKPNTGAVGTPVTRPNADNPLLRSGLAFTGANLRSGEKDDGILTALEASGLNLWGTKLVVLSACDTGLGEIRNGEGVFGLRRSFMLAGAESLVMSLWPVSDLVTRNLMTNYYKNLKEGMGRGEALRQVKLAMLKRANRRHPFYWASFIQSGEWANLDGKR